jgi:hypothetical protein
MESSFYLGGLVQGRRPYVIWVSEGLKGLWIKVRDSLSQITAKNKIVKGDLPLNGTCLRDKTNKTRICAAVVSTSKY